MTEQNPVSWLVHWKPDQTGLPVNISFWRLKIKWQSFNYFILIVVYHRATKANRFAVNRIKKFQPVAELC